MISKLEQLRGLFNEFHNNVKENRRYYDLDFEELVAPPPAEGDRDEMMAVMATTARRAIDDPSDHILPMPRIKVPVRPTTGNIVNEQASAEARRDFLSAWWETEEADFGVVAAARKVLLNEGRVCVRKQLRWDAIPDYPGKDASQGEKQKFRRAIAKLGQHNFLWKLELLDNLSVFEDYTNPRDPRYVYVEHQILAEEARRMFGNRDEIPPDDYSTVTYVEEWTRPEVKWDGSYEEGAFNQYINGEKVRSSVNPYPYIPIVIEDAGYGLSHHLAKPHERYVGLTQHTHSIFVAESRQMTAMEAVAEITAFSPLMTRNMPPDKQIEVGPRAVIPLDGGPDESTRETIEPMAWPNIPATVPQMIQITGNMANETLKFGTLGGTVQKGVDTATEASQLMQGAAAKLQGPVLSLQRLVTKVSKWVLMDVEMLSTKVSVFGTAMDGNPSTLTIGPKDINGFYSVSAELATTDADAVELTKARFWMDAYNAVPFLSAMTAMEKGRISDEPMKEMVKRSAEDVYLSDLMRQARVMQGGQMFGLLMQMIQSMQSGGNGTPGAPNEADNLVEQEGITAPVTDRIVEDAYAQRNTQQSQYLA